MDRPSSLLFRALVERHGDDRGAGPAPADVDIEFSARRRVLDRQVHHANGLLEKRRLRATGDRSGSAAPARDVDLVTGTRNAALEQLEADDLARRPVRFLRAEGAGAEEVLFVPADDPAQVGLEHRRGLVDVVAVEAHARLEAEGVARAEPARNDVERLA